MKYNTVHWQFLKLVRDLSQSYDIVTQWRRIDGRACSDLSFK